MRLAGALALGAVIGVARAGTLTTDILNVQEQATLKGLVSIGTTTPTNLLYYSFNTNATPVTDESGNGNSGTVSGALWTNDAKFGAGAYVFNGSSDYIQASDSASLDIQGAFTLCAWAKFSATSSVRALVMKHDDSTARAYGMWFESGWLALQISSSGNGSQIYTIRSTNSVASTNWQFYAVSWNGTPNTGGGLYVNAQAIAIQTNANTFSGTNIYNSSQPLRVGSKSTGSWNFGGSIDDVRIYGRALTASELATLYAGSSLAGTGSLSVATSATFSGPTLIQELVRQGDVEMGSFTNKP